MKIRFYEDKAHEAMRQAAIDELHRMSGNKHIEPRKDCTACENVARGECRKCFSPTHDMQGEQIDAEGELAFDTIYFCLACGRAETSMGDRIL